MCSSWTWCSRSVTRRGVETMIDSPQGASLPFVEDANCMASRSASGKTSIVVAVARLFCVCSVPVGTSVFVGGSQDGHLFP